MSDLRSESKSESGMVLIEQEYFLVAYVHMVNNSACAQAVYWFAGYLQVDFKKMRKIEEREYIK